MNISKRHIEALRVECERAMWEMLWYSTGIQSWSVYERLQARSQDARRQYLEAKVTGAEEGGER